MRDLNSRFFVVISSVMLVNVVTRHLHRDRQGPADGRENIRRTPHPRELEGDKIWQDADVGCGGKYKYVMEHEIHGDTSGVWSSITQVV